VTKVTQFLQRVKARLIIQVLKLVLGLALGAYFDWWSLEVLNRLPPYFD
jgi:hypothetical protein